MLSGYRSKGVHVSDRELSISKLARLSGVGIETIRYYERIGLMPHPLRTDGGRRAFGPDDVATLSFIKRCRALLALRASDRTCCDVKSIA